MEIIIITPYSVLALFWISSVNGVCDTVFMDRPQNTLVLTGDSPVLKCSLRVPGSDVLLWFNQTDEMIVNHLGVLPEHQNKFELVDGNNLKINQVDLTDGGRYSCRSFANHRDEPASADLIVFESEPQCHIKDSTVAILEGAFIPIHCFFKYQGYHRTVVQLKLPNDTVITVPHFPLTQDVSTDFFITADLSLKDQSLKLSVTFVDTEGYIGCPDDTPVSLTVRTDRIPVQAVCSKGSLPNVIGDGCVDCSSVISGCVDCIMASGRTTCIACEKSMEVSAEGSLCVAKSMDAGVIVAVILGLLGMIVIIPWVVCCIYCCKKGKSDTYRIIKGVTTFRTFNLEPRSQGFVKVLSDDLCVVNENGFVKIKNRKQGVKLHHTVLHEMLKFKAQTINAITKGNSVTLVIQPGYNDTPGIGFHETNAEEDATLTIMVTRAAESGENRHKSKLVVIIPQDKVSEVMECLDD